MRSIVLAAALAAGLAGASFAAEEQSQAVKAAVVRLAASDDAGLERALSSVSPVEREAAAVVLERRADAASAQISALSDALGDDVVAVRLAATRALGACGDAALPAAARLERLAGWATELKQRYEAALALARIPGAREHLLRLFEDPAQRVDTAAGLAGLGAKGRAALVALSDAPQWRTRAAVTAVLPDTENGATDADVRAALGRRLRDGSSAVRTAALLALPRIRGGALLTAADVDRVFARETQAAERNAFIVAAAEDETTGRGVRSAVALHALQSGDGRLRLDGVRLAHAIDGAHAPDEAVLIALGAVAGSDDVGPAREAAACLRIAGLRQPLPESAAALLRHATRHVRARVATEAAAALARSGHDGPQLAAPLARLLYAESWGGWTSGLMVRPPYGQRHPRRNLRAGRGRKALALPAVPLLTRDDIVSLLRRHPEAAADALSSFLVGEFAATRANAAWAAAEVCPKERVVELLTPLLDDSVDSVRIVAGLRLARIDARTDRVARMFVELLLVEREFVRTTYELLWDDEMIAELPRDRLAAVSALVSHDRDLDELRHLRSILEALGPEAHLLLVNEMLEGDATRRETAAELLGRVDVLSPAAIDSLRRLVDHPELGDLARRFLPSD